MSGPRPILVRPTLAAALIAALVPPAAARDMPLSVPQGRTFEGQDLGVYAESFGVPAAVTASKPSPSHRACGRLSS